MARYTGSVCRLCRAEGKRLFLKGERCHGGKCAITKKRPAPGKGPRTRTRKQSNYGLQLREKQKTKRMYGVLENQFRTYYKRAAQRKGVTGELLLQMLECRLDNIVFRLGFAPSRKAARQLVRHRHVSVDGKTVDIPSFQVSQGDSVQIREKSRQLPLIHDALKRVGDGRQSNWLEIDKVNLSGTLVEYPKREEIPTPVEEQLIVELYSK